MHSDPTDRGHEVPEDPVLESASLGASQVGGGNSQDDTR